MNYTKNIRILIVFILSCSFLSAQIDEIKNIEEVYKYVEDECSILVLFDLDNTVIRSQSLWGTDECFSASVDYLQKQYNVKIPTAIDIVVPLFKEAVIKNDAKLIEKNTPYIIKELKNKNHPVMALTARSSHEIISATKNQLQKLGITFSFFNKAIDDFKDEANLKNATFNFGIMSCANNDKGLCLKHVLETLKKNKNINPQKIVFIDDKKKYLEQVGNIAKSLNIKFIGLRYGFCDNIVNSFVLNDDNKLLLTQKANDYLENKIQIGKISKIVEKACKNETNPFGYSVWSHHITSVVKFGKVLAEKLSADSEVVEIAALLHDYAGIKDKKYYPEHHIYGAREAEKILQTMQYPAAKIEMVKQCILTHRGSVVMNKKSPEQICIASADAMAHIDQMVSLLHYVYTKKKLSIDNGKVWVREKLKRSWNKLCPEARGIIGNRYLYALKILE